MIKNLLDLIKHNFINIPRWHTKRRIVVIESDDWGAIRMPSAKTYKAMLDEGIRVDRDQYCRFDGLETKKDLENLYEVLLSVKDKNGRHPVITANAVVANPDFHAIKESDFTQYFFEPITETFKNSERHKGAWEAWQEGMKQGLIYPQFHGREHLNVKKWMNALQNPDSITRKAFEYGTFGLTSEVDSSIKLNYMGAFNSGLPEDITSYSQILSEGLDLFEKIFGFKSESFIATTYTWHPRIEKTLQNKGVKFLQGRVKQRIPLDDDSTFKYKSNNFTGTKSPNGLLYLMRNCTFEPSHFINFDNMSRCLKQIQTSFFWQKPAIISCHRINFIGSIDANNTKSTLPQFQQLLTKIVKIWPDVEFMTSAQLGNLIIND